MQLEEIFQIEEVIEKSFRSIFETQSKIAHVYPSRDKRDSQTPWVEVKFLTGQITEKHVHIIAPENRQWYYAGWMGSRLELTVCTQRQNNGSQHKILLGKLRYECQLPRLLLTWPQTDAAKVHAIADIREDGTVHTVDSESDLDMTTLTFLLLHNLVDSAFEN